MTLDVFAAWNEELWDEASCFKAQNIERCPVALRHLLDPVHVERPILRVKHDFAFVEGKWGAPQIPTPVVTTTEHLPRSAEPTFSYINSAGIDEESKGERPDVGAWMYDGASPIASPIAPQEEQESDCEFESLVGKKRFCNPDRTHLLSLPRVTPMRVSDFMHSRDQASADLSKVVEDLKVMYVCGFSHLSFSAFKALPSVKADMKVLDGHPEVRDKLRFFCANERRRRQCLV